jgi:hypothetical protein
MSEIREFVAMEDGATVHSSVLDRRLADVASNTVADVLPRWFTNFDGSGVGLRGGRFTYTGSDRVVFRLRDVKWVDDVAVSGSLVWDRTTGAIRAQVSVAGPPGESGDLTVIWSDWDLHAIATVRGQIGDRPVDLQLPAS